MCAVERRDGLTESFADIWIADSGTSFHVTHPADQLSDVRLCNDKVRINDNHLIDVAGYGTLTVVFPGDLTVKLLDVGYVPALAFNSFSLLAAHKHGVGFMTEEEGLCIALFNGGLRFEGDVSSDFNVAYRIEPENDYVPFPLVTSDSTENSAEISDSGETAVDINVSHCMHGHCNELLSRETAK